MTFPRCANICFSGSAAEKCQTCHRTGVFCQAAVIGWQPGFLQMCLILIDKVGSQMCPNLGSWNWVSSWQTCRYVFLGDHTEARLWWLDCNHLMNGCNPFPYGLQADPGSFLPPVLQCHEGFFVWHTFGRWKQWFIASWAKQIKCLGSVRRLCVDWEILLQKAQRLGTLPSLCQPGRMPRKVKEGVDWTQEQNFMDLSHSSILQGLWYYVLFRSPVAFQSMRQARCHRFRIDLWISLRLLGHLRTRTWDTQLVASERGTPQNKQDPPRFQLVCKKFIHKRRKRGWPCLQGAILTGCDLAEVCSWMHVGVGDWVVIIIQTSLTFHYIAHCSILVSSLLLPSHRCSTFWFLRRGLKHWSGPHHDFRWCHCMFGVIV